MVWVLGTTADNSVEHHAAGIPVSPTYTSPDLAEGYEHYNEMCVMCHGAPGVKAGDLSQGLNPSPPDLVESVTDMSPSEVFWVTKNGIKMTGMPGFGPTHDDRKLWDLTAFVKRLPEMTPEEVHRHGQGCGGRRARAGPRRGMSRQAVVFDSLVVVRHAAHDVPIGRQVDGRLRLR